MSLGIVAAAYATIGPCMFNSGSYVGWPQISIALSWTVPAVIVRIIKGRVVNKIQTKDLKERSIILSDHPQIKSERIRTAIVALGSVLAPWVTIVLAY